MKKLWPLGLLLLAVALLSLGCATGSSVTNYQADLDSLLAARWQAYAAARTNWGGGLGLMISTPRGSFFSAASLESGASWNWHFRSASTTKNFTAAAIMLLCQRGKLRLDDLITAEAPGTSEPYVPATAAYDIPYKGRITIRQLLEHRAGVFDVTNNAIPTTESVPYAGWHYVDYVRECLSDEAHTFTADETVGVAAATGLYHNEPGAAFHYSNTGYAMLGKIIERLSGQRYDQFVRDNLLVPNGLTGTSFPYLGTDQALPAPYVGGHVWQGGQLFPFTEDNMSANVAEGNCITTPAELAAWIRKLLRGEAGLEQTYVDMMKQCQPTGEQHQYYGLGVTYTPGLGYGHNGAHAGYLTVMRYDPASDVTLVIFSSTLNATDTYDQLYFMYDLGFRVRELLGYPTSEAG